MTPRIIRGSREEIAQQVSSIDGEIDEVIVFLRTNPEEIPASEDIFSEMKAHTVSQPYVNDAREGVYQLEEGE